MKKFLLFLVLLGALALALLFFVVDRNVGRRLTENRPDNIPAVYSEAFHIDPGSLVKPSTVRQELLIRGYRPVPGRPERPGEFRIGTRIEVVTRAFTLPSGNERPANYVSYDPGAGTLQSERAQDADFTLEPQLIAHLGSGEMRATTYVELAQIPSTIRNAVIAIEDERFYRHHGIDFEGILRAMFANLRALALVQGGSTLTQQLAKNVFFTSERSLSRKVREALAAISLERRLTKDQILEMYLNEVYLGQEGAVAVHGVSEAARTWFGKKLDELSLSESALIAGIIKGPSYYSPRKHLKRAMERRDLVLDKLVELGYATEKEARIARVEPVRIVDSPIHSRTAPYYITALNRDLSQVVDAEVAIANGVQVYTGLSLPFQNCAEQALDKGLAELEKKYPRLIRKSQPRLEGSLVAIEPHSGKIRAWVGGRDYGSNQYDHVNQSRRQIGSTVKPFLYLTALDSGLNAYKVATPLTILTDQPMNLTVHKKSWVPENYDKKFRGDVTLRYALENSLNIPAVYVAQRVGVPALVSTLKHFRVNEDPPAVPALALGAAETDLLRLTAGYGALANGGRYVAPRLFVSALDSTGQTFAHSEIFEEQVADENAVFVLTNIMQGVLERGTGQSVRKAGFMEAAAGKTGTSNDTRDAWFVGFVPDLVAGVWVGYDDNQKIGLAGGTAAAPIWAEFMKCTESYRDPLAFIAPSGVEYASIDSASGERATADCPSGSVVREVFVRGTAPTRRCHIHSDGGRVEDEDLDNGDQREDRRRRKKSLWDMIFG